ncbi:MAG: hypothetical protein IBX69_13740 [Anaerolineales bacterium]|nr:hypothetical protein [Anaerolineales bacterium]
MTPGEVIYSLDCQMEVDGFTTELDRSLFHMESTTSRWNVHWSAVDFSLIQAEILVEVETSQLQSTLVTTEDQLHLVVIQNHTDSHEIYIPQNSLLVDELPWRLSALPFEVAFRTQAAVAWSARWDAELQQSVPGYEQTAIIVRGGEPLAVPAGNFISWRVTVGEDKTAWYDVEPPHTLLRYENGILSYFLK